MRRKQKASEPNSQDVSHSKNVLRNVAYYGLGNGVRITDEDCIVLDRYIEFLEEQLCQMVEHYQGVPTGYLNMVRKEQLEWRPLGPTPLF